MTTINSDNARALARAHGPRFDAVAPIYAKGGKHRPNGRLAVQLLRAGVWVDESTHTNESEAFAAWARARFARLVYVTTLPDGSKDVRLVRESRDPKDFGKRVKADPPALTFPAREPDLKPFKATAVPAERMRAGVRAQTEAAIKSNATALRSTAGVFTVTADGVPYVTALDAPFATGIARALNAKGRKAKIIPYAVDGGEMFSEDAERRKSATKKMELALMGQHYEGEIPGMGSCGCWKCQTGKDANPPTYARKASTPDKEFRRIES